MIRFHHWLVAALLFLCAPSLAAERTLMVFGDSLSAAYNLDIDQGWVHLLAHRMEETHLPWRVVNASVTGETTSGGLSRIPEDLRRHKPAIVVIELGANDALRGLPVAGTEENLAAMVQAAQKAGARVLVVGIQVPPNYGTDYTQRFSQVFTGVAKKYKTGLVPFLLEGLPVESRDMFQPDGIHPRAEAHPRIMENVWAEFKKQLK